MIAMASSSYANKRYYTLDKIIDFVTNKDDNGLLHKD